MSLNSLVSELNYLLSQKEGSMAATTLIYKAQGHSEYISISNEIVEKTKNSNSLNIKGPLSSCITKYLISVAQFCVLRKSPGNDVLQLAQSCFSLAEDAAKEFGQFMKTQSKIIWWVPLTSVFLIQLRQSSVFLDDMLEKTNFNSKMTEHRTKTSEVLREYLTIINMDREEWYESKGQAVLGVINQNIKLFFQLGSTQLCGTLIKQIDSKFPDISCFPISEQITYKFYLGRIAILKEQYTEAEQHLSFALENLPLRSNDTYLRQVAYNNQIRILKLLVPIRLYLRQSIDVGLLENLELNEYVGLVEAIKYGNIRLFNQLVIEYDDIYHEWGVSLIIDQLKLHVYAALLRQIYYGYLVKEKGDKAHLMYLPYVLKAIHIHGEDDLDIEDLECILTNLLFKKFVKGYIARGKCLIMKKGNPFS